MKRLSGFALAIFGLLLLVAAPSARAESGNPFSNFHAHIDFPFVVGQKVMPPGTYSFHMLDELGGHEMMLNNADNTHEAGFVVQYTSPLSYARHARLDFKKYGNMHFLASIEQPLYPTVIISNSRKMEARMLERAALKNEQHEQPQRTARGQ